MPTSEAIRRRQRHAARQHAAAAALLLCAMPLLAQYDPAISYQNRGDRYEGLKSLPIGGFDVELLSALIVSGEPRSGWPPRMHLGFYLPDAEPVFVTVRQPQSRTTYYWLDRVVPSPPWKPRAFNEFAWPTEPVLQKLGGLTLDDLGVVVHLQNPGPGKREEIAPAALFATRPPATTGEYRFMFKTNGAAQVTCTIYRRGKEVWQRPQHREQAGSPFTVRWSTQGQADGDYTLALSGYFEDNTLLAKEAHFFHRAAWP
jgi:hypothetical protein